MGSLPKTIVVMGVSGTGKSLIGQKLAEALGAEFEDADDFHSAANKEKLTRGVPLTDSNRWPWLQTLRQRILLHRKRDGRYVLACSALKQDYRDLLRGDDSPAELVFVYLKGAKTLIRQRLEQRQHFMPESLLDSQFATLEEPEEAIVVEVQHPPAEIVEQILQALPDSGSKGSNSN